jgi:hypothetical protein
LCTFGAFGACSTDVGASILPPPAVCARVRHPAGVVARVPVAAPTISGAKWPDPDRPLHRLRRIGL